MAGRLRTLLAEGIVRAVGQALVLPDSIADIPLALADLHRTLVEDATVTVTARAGQGRSGDRFRSDRFEDLCTGAGFQIDESELSAAGVTTELTKIWTLPDTVGPAMRVLICGLNPSPHSADVGVGFARPGNRFWPAANAAGLVTADRDPRHALLRDGVGMTDLVKRPSRTAAELSTDEYANGLARVERLTVWLQPQVVCFVGLAGWRAAVDRKAVAGLQPDRFGGRPAYVMPSTSGLNAHSTADGLRQHLTTMMALGCQTG